MGCTAQLTAATTSLPVGPGIGQVRVDAETATGYQVTAVSKANSGGANHAYTIVHNIGGVFNRQCAPQGEGGCRSDGTW